MDADEFRDYILGFIFYKYLSEKMQNYGDDLLKEDGITYTQLTSDDTETVGREKIASFLSAVDTKIEQLSHNAKLLEEFKKALLQQMFV